ncbi:MAG: hypothetical protein IPI23_14175 [Bacteroidetes bacterium]|nr:hypothetical protein [Bacteroidota bacterium]
MKIYNLESTLSFGKFKGKTLSEILSIQPSYIKWCIINLDHFVLPQDSGTDKPSILPIQII